MVEKDFLAALKIIKEGLESAGVEWFVCGSVSLKMQGMNVVPNDLDIVISNNDKSKVMELFRNCGIVNLGFIKSDELETLQMHINNVEIEFCAELSHGIYFSKRKNVVIIKGIPYLNLLSQAQAYKECGRKEKEKMVKDFIKS